MKKIYMIGIMMLMVTLVACNSNSEETRTSLESNDIIEEQDSLAYDEETQNTENSVNENKENDILPEEDSYYSPGNFPLTVTPYDFHGFGDLAVALQMEYDNKFFFCDGNAKPIDDMRNAIILSFPEEDGFLAENGIKSYSGDGYVLLIKVQNGFTVRSNTSFNMNFHTWNGICPLYHIGQYDSRYGIIPLSSSTYASNINLIPCSVIDWATVEELTINGVTGYVFCLKR